ncbi:MAG TPA: TIM-barrel domain-containing protein, partial [Terriglobales bacterium]|nr:TIM-barrel domain-containing protein [Terriglobales bacterium]
QFTRSVKDGWLIINTGALTVRYRESGGAFTSDDLSISCALNGRQIDWRPGMENQQNLGGTLRTLDGVKGYAPLPPGLLSRDGWVLVDDSNSPLYDRSPWPWVLARGAAAHQDWYFFAYGHDYKRELLDVTRVAGRIPLPPLFAFGTWWSRYWAYTDQELEQLVSGFHEHDVPLDIMVVDMDWHKTFGLRWDVARNDASGHRLGWSGYTWDDAYFPDPPAFLQWMHQQGLKVTLNLHPASGIQPWEQHYPEMARAMGIDPATQQYVPFHITDKKFAENYLRLIHDPLERQGVDFWWLDWQQEQGTDVAGVNPTFWLNYVHFTDMERRGKRPLIFHRWGGLGNHRYQIGFSGDTASVWESLAYQPYFTATASNVLYGYWSHDIGGHIPGVVSPELFTRWVQFGVFSPILRTHTTKNPDSERRIWAYPVEYAEAMRDAYVLRYELIPYIYTAARQAYDSGISICRPMYYDYPEAEEAYEIKDEFMFGDDLLVAPITTPAEGDAQLARRRVWLPPGEWIEWTSGAEFKGPAIVERDFALDEWPVYARAGSIIAMQPRMSHTGEKPVDPLILTVFPGGSGRTRIYADDGNSLGYKATQFTWTPVSTRTARGSMQIEIGPVEGKYAGMVESRGYEVRLRSTLPPARVAANGLALPYRDDGQAPGWHYDGNTLTTIITLPRTSVHQAIHVVVDGSEAGTTNAELLDGVPGRLLRLKAAMDVLNTTWPQEWSPDELVAAYQTGNRITLHPEAAATELKKLHDATPAIVERIHAMKISPEVMSRALAKLGISPSASAVPAPK